VIEYLDPVTGAFVEALTKSFASKTVELAVNGISKLLGTALQKGDKKEAENIIKQESIENPVAELVGQILTDSYVVPFIPAHGATADDVLTVFASVVSIGLRISKTANADIVLPGSFLGEKSISIFTTHGKDITFSKRDRTLVMSFEPGSGMGIIAVDSDPIDLCNQAAEKLRLARELQTSYISKFDLYRLGIGVSELTTRTAKFRNSREMSPDQRTHLEIDKDFSPLHDEKYEKGIRMMLEYSNHLRADPQSC
jgi:hypothetical protein